MQTAPTIEQRWRQYGDLVPEGRSGAWRVERRRGVPYTRLMHDREPMPVMSNTELELIQHRAAIRRASFGGTVLACGLGLGCFARACLEFDAVERVDVVELSPDVIALVAPSLAEYVSAERLVIHEGDAFDFDPSGCWWDVAWLDVWARGAPDHKPESDALWRRFAPHAGWLGSWLDAQHETARVLAGRWLIGGRC
jgi:hypothetical protein